MRSLVAVVLLIALSACSRQEATTSNAAEEGVPKAGVDRAKAGGEAPNAAFVDTAGKEVRIADFKGRPVLLNLWASWCAPCVKELPTLDALGRSRKDGLIVLAVSQDSGPQASVKAFLAKLGVPGLGAFQDPAMRLSGALDAQVLPTSVLYGADGREVWRYTGDLDWTGAEAAKLLAEAGAPATG
ncbi:MAG: TlpA disulfide reductase family protein [Sphingomicrobium sp.]